MASRLAGALALCVAALLPVFGCAETSTLRIASSEHGAVLEPAWRQGVFRMRDRNTVDLYLSDLPSDTVATRLAQAAAGEPGPPGTVLVINMFLDPEAGRTPIDFTASNTSVTAVVLTGESWGVYGGGGFLLPSSFSSDRSFEGVMRGASLRMIRAEPGFEDRLGVSELSGEVIARRDDRAANAIAARLMLLTAPR